MTEKELNIQLILPLLEYYDIQAEDLFELPDIDVTCEDIIDGDDFQAYAVSNPSDAKSNAVYLNRPNTFPPNAAMLRAMSGWIQVKEGYNPNDYNYKIIAIKK